MRTITPELAAYLRSRLQVGVAAFAGRVEVDIPAEPTPGPDRWFVLVPTGAGHAMCMDGVTKPDGTFVDNYSTAGTNPYGTLHYFRTGGTGWSFPTYGIVDAGAEGGTFDVGGANVGNITLIGPINGPGTMTIHTMPIPGYPGSTFIVHAITPASYVDGVPSGNVWDIDETLVTDAPYGTDVSIEVNPELAGGYDTASFQPKRISLNRNLRMGPDQAEVELANEDLALGWGPTSIFPTNSRWRIYQWLGDVANEVLVFTGIIDKIADGRDVLTTRLTGRSLAGAILVDQTFSATAPQGADEDGAVRTEDNGVYLSVEVDYVVADRLERAGWPAADIDIEATSFVLDEFLVDDGAPEWDTLVRLGEFVGYTLWDDEDAVIHFRRIGEQASADAVLTPDYEYEVGAA